MSSYFSVRTAVPLALCFVACAAKQQLDTGSSTEPMAGSAGELRQHRHRQRIDGRQCIASPLPADAGRSR